MSCAFRSGRHRGFLAAFVLKHAHRLLACRLLRDEVGELHRIQVFVHLVVELRPQVVGHAALLVVAVFLAAALRRVQRLVHRRDDVRDRYPFETARERVAAARPARAVDQRVTSQLAEELFQIRERDALPLADAGERHRTLAAVHGEVQHRGHCESSFGRQSHGCTLNGFEYPMYLVKYTQSRGNQSTICSPPWAPGEAASGTLHARPGAPQSDSESIRYAYPARRCDRAGPGPPWRADHPPPWMSPHTRRIPVSRPFPRASCPARRE